MKFRIPHLLLSLGLAWGLPGDAQVSPSRAWREQPRRTLKELQPGMPIGRVAYDPRDRWDWLLTWYGGLPSAEHLKARMEITAREMGKYPHLMPRPEGTPQALVAGAAVPAWRPLGPTKESVGSNHPGPDMDSGRLVDIVTHPSNPQILYLATAAGGVFKTTNASFGATGGWSWTNITDSIPSTGMGGNTSVGALAMSPADPNTLFLGLGDKEGSFVSNAASAAVGFFKTTDGGNTWSAPILLGSTTRTHAILPLSGSVVLVGGNKGLFRSGDGGNTFSPITSGLNSDPVWSIQAFSTTEVILTQYLSSSTGKIYYSSDAGLTWTLASISGLPLTPGRMTVSTSPASATQAWGIASNSSGSFAKGVLKSVDKGHTWTYVAAPTAPGSLYQTYPASGQFSGDGGQGFYNHCLVVDPSDINKLMAGANHALYRSLDGGLTWSQMAYGYDQDTVYSHPDYHCWAWSKTGPPVLFIGNDGGLSVVRDPYRSTIPRTGNSGSQTSDPTFIDNRWNQGLNSYEIWKFGNTNASSPAGSRDRVFLGLQDNGGRWRVNDGSGLTNSTAFDSVVGGDGCGGNINAANGDKVMGAYPELQVYRTTDGWNTGFMATTGLTDAGTSNAPFIANLIPDPNDPTGDTIYTHSYKKIYKTTNYGGIWTSIGTTGIDPARSIRAFAISKSSPSRMAVVTSGGLGWGTTDGGSSWTAFGSFPGNQTFMSFVTFDPTNAQTLYAGSVSQDTTASHLWKTTNGGSTWGALDGNAGFPFGMPVEGLVIDPGNPNVVYVGTDIGVYQSTNGGSSWSRFGSGLPYANVKDLYIAPDGSFLRAATFGRGAWEILPSSTPPTGPTITQHPASVSKNAGEQATFSVAATGTGTLSYQWQKGGASIPGATSATYTTPPTIAADDGAQFRAVVTDSTGSNTSNPATLTVVPCTGGGGGTTQVLQNPGFESGVSPWVQSNTLIIDNDNAITAHGGSWYAFLGDYSSSTTDSLYQTVAIDANATAADLRFWMTIGNESGTPAGATNILTVKVRNSSGADLGTLATFNNTQANYPTYVQRGPWSLLAWKGQTVQVYLTSFQPGGTGTGTAFIVDDFTFNVTTPGGGGGTPPTIITSPANQTVTVGSTVTFTSSAGGTMPITMQWRKNGAVIQGANNPSFTIASAQVSDSGTYDVQAFNCAGFATSNAATLTVNVASPVTVTVAPKPVALMVGGTQSFAATVTGTPNTAVTWVLSGLGGLSTTTGNPTVFTAPSTLATTPSTATLTATSVADPAKSDSVTITIRSRDLSGDTLTDVLDLATLARYFGQPASAFPAGDLDGSGTIDEGDLAILLAGI